MPWDKRNDLANDPSYLEPRITDIEDKLNDMPTIPTKTSELTNDSGFLTTINKSEVGLGSVQNYGVATQTEAEAGTVSDKYMTPQRTAQAIEKLAPKPNASQISIIDASNLFTTTNVEGALSELFTNVSDGKSLVAAAITDKGISASGDDTFSQLANKIGLISEGKKWASGTSTPIDGILSVTGLDFAPSIITWSSEINGSTSRVGIVRSELDNYLAYGHTALSNSSKGLAKNGNLAINNDGFVVNLGRNESISHWIAIA